MKTSESVRDGISGCFSRWWRVHGVSDAASATALSISLQRAATIEQCPNCQRIVFFQLDEDVGGETADVAASPA